MDLASNLYPGIVECSRPRQPQIEILQVLACNSFASINAQDDSGWAMLHQEAAFGTIGDVKVFASTRGILTFAHAKFRVGSALCAVCFGTVDILTEQWPLYNNSHLSRDRRG
jgi:hypothetical protein